MAKKNHGHDMTLIDHCLIQQVLAPTLKGNSAEETREEAREMSVRVFNVS